MWLRGLRVAREWRIRPLEYFEIEGPGPWGWVDRTLAEAEAIYRDSLCGECGYPRLLAWDESNESFFEASEICCVACAAREARYREGELDPGVKILVDYDR